MDLPRAGREYAKWDTQPATSDQLEVSFDAGTTWHDLTPGTVDGDDVWTADPDGTVHAILVAGPDTTNNPEGCVELEEGVTRTTVRMVANPEIIIRDTGVIRVPRAPVAVPAP